MRLDHLVYAASDLDADALALAWSLGVEPTDVFEYPHLGIATRHVSIGDVTIEVAVVREARVADATPWTRWLGQWCQTRPGFASWALQVDDIEAVGERLGQAPRVSSIGTFSTVGLDESFEARYLPFFISWSSPRRAVHQAADWVVDRLDVEGDADVFRQWVGGAEALPIDLSPGSSGITAVRVRRGQVETTLRPPSAG